MYFLNPLRLAAALPVALIVAAAANADAQVGNRPARALKPQPAALDRGPATTAEVNGLHAAFRSALADRTVRTAAMTGISRQLRTVRPIALVDGAWATPIDLGALYSQPTIRTAITARVGGRMPAGRADLLLGRKLTGAVGLAFTPIDLGNEVIGGMARDLTASMSEEALAANMTGMSGDQQFLIAILPAFFEMLGDLFKYY
ncbi:MAG: hypothetical protein ACREL6_12240, partial [Gemmatimonadales bacterium]